VNSKSSSFFILGLITGALLTTGGLSLFWGQRDQGEHQVRVLRLAHGLDTAHPVHRAMVRLAERVDELSAGTVQVRVFSGGVLGSETENIEQLQRGALDITKVSAAAMESFVPENAVFGLPYIFRDAAHFWNVLNGSIGQELLDLGANRGLRGLCYYDAGARSFYTTARPILTPDDLRGLKIRVMQSRTAMDMIQIMGAAPTPISWGELYTSLQQRVVDGAENNPPSFLTSRHYEVCRFYSLNEHTRVPDIVVISERLWLTLPIEVQHWIQQAADESSQYQRELWRASEEQALAAVQEFGVEVFHPDTAPFVEIVAPLLAQHEGTPIGELVQRIRKHP